MHIIGFKHLSEQFSNKEPVGPRRITFRSAHVCNDQDQPLFLNISVTVGDGDVFGILKSVVECGGIGEEDSDGVFRFIPWPCACVEIHPVN